MLAEAVMDDELMLVAPADHPFAARESVTLDEVLAQPFVLREKGSGTRQVVEDELWRHDAEERNLKVVSEFGSTAAIKSAVEAGLGLSVLSVWTIKHETALGLLKTVPIRDVSFKRQFYAVRLPSSLLSLPAAAFMEQLRGMPV